MIEQGDIGRLNEVPQFGWVAPQFVERLDPDSLVRPWDVRPDDADRLARLVHERIVMPDRRPLLRDGVESEFVPRLGHVALHFLHDQETVRLRLPLTPERLTRNKHGEDTWIMLGVAQKLGILVVATRKPDNISAVVLPITNHALHAVISSMQNTPWQD